MDVNSLRLSDAYIRISKLTIIGWGNGLAPGWHQAIIWTNDGILLIWISGTNFSEILIEFYTFSFKKLHLKMSSGKWQPFGLGLSELECPCWCILCICVFFRSRKWPSSASSPRSTTGPSWDPRAARSNRSPPNTRSPSSSPTDLSHNKNDLLVGYHGNGLIQMIQYWWFRASLECLQCISYGKNTVLCWAIDMSSPLFYCILIIHNVFVFATTFQH